MTPRADPLHQVTIIGASVAGVSVARGLRAEGFDGEIVLVSAEREWPYDRPPLSKQVLCGDWDVSRTALLTEAEAASLRLDVLLGQPARHLDIAGRQVVLTERTAVPFGTCVIATGAFARPAPWPPVPGMDVLRTLQDAVRLRERFATGGHVAVIGGGFIGAEVASAARSLGLSVTMIDPLPRPMERVVGPEGADLFAALAARGGVELRLGVGVERVRPAGDDVELMLSDGAVVVARTAVVGIGAIPNDTWVAESGLLVADGIVCDEFCRAVGAEGIYAAGDVARWYHPDLGTHVRVEHWTNAVEQAQCVAHNIAHPADLRPHSAVPYVWTDQHGWKLQVVGQPWRGVGHEVVGEVSPAHDRPRGIFVYADAPGRVIGAMSINWPRGLAECRRAIRAQVDAQAVVRRLGEHLAEGVQRAKIGGGRG